MIVDALIALLCTVMDFIFGLLPEWTWTEIYNVTPYEDLYPGETGEIAFPADHLGGSFTDNPIAGILGIMTKFNVFMPVYEALYIMNAVLLFGLAYLAWRGIAMLIGWIRGSGTAS